MDSLEIKLCRLQEKDYRRNARLRKLRMERARDFKILHDLGMTHKEIADAFEISRETVRKDILSLEVTDG